MEMHSSSNNTKLQSSHRITASKTLISHFSSCSLYVETHVFDELIKMTRSRTTHTTPEKQILSKYIFAFCGPPVCRRILRVICLDVCVIPLLLWWPGHALTMAEGCLTLRHTKLRGGMCLMLWRVSYGALAGREVSCYLITYSLRLLSAYRATPLHSSGVIWLPLQRKYEYELLFA